MVTAGLDLRGKASTWLRPQWGRTTKIMVLLCDISEVAPCIVTPTAGQNLGSFSAVLRKRASSSDVHETPLGSYCRGIVPSAISLPCKKSKEL